MIVVRTEMKCHVQSFRFCYHSFVVIFIGLLAYGISHNWLEYTSAQDQV